MHLDVGLGGDALLYDESGDLLALVTLELDNLSELLVVNNGTVACKFLLEGLQQLLLVILCIRGGGVGKEACVRGTEEQKRTIKIDDLFGETRSRGRGNAE